MAVSQYVNFFKKERLVPKNSLTARITFCVFKEHKGARKPFFLISFGLHCLLFMIFLFSKNFSFLSREIAAPTQMVEVELGPIADKTNLKGDPTAVEKKSMTKNPIHTPQKATSSQKAPPKNSEVEKTQEKPMNKKESPKKIELKKAEKKTIIKEKNLLKKQKPGRNAQKTTDKKRTLEASTKSSKNSLDDFLKKDHLLSASSSASKGGNTLTISELDALRQGVRNTIKRCWKPSVSLSPEQGVVKLKLSLKEDGTVIKAEAVDKGRVGNDVLFSYAVENAVRAVLDPECNPLPLPLNKYKHWKELVLTFNPAEAY